MKCRRSNRGIENEIIIGLYFGKRPEKNTLVTLRQTVKVIANPVIALFFGTLMIMVFQNL